ncbi:hypothetical protein NIE88_04700 [Sporolactobacillus shoreicorticis]|uniref:Uncharacterized protein n=1 Tax=Sporolactobacillus shoreicorticis TaxID=1923877 RepID=A0ABW5RZ65_9BACL|nr:hypothetical protein [Sporolactobacillus shoreicorticis]MCO7125073.1 hypothetical protein [Sporolactobacillus shoreicorticis]
MKKLLYYAGLFVACFAIQWYWYTQIMTKANKTMLDMLLASIVFIVIVVLLDYVSGKRRR